MSENPVLIVGAGPTGLVLALELARRSVPFHLVDRRPEPLGRDRAIVVKSRSLEIFQGLGLADTFLQRGRVIRGVNLFASDKKVASVELGGLDSPFAFDLCLPEEETEAILTDELERLGGQVERGVEFAGLEQDQHGVRARLRSLQDGERTLEASWVIGTTACTAACARRLATNSRATIIPCYGASRTPILLAGASRATTPPCRSNRRS